MKNILQGFWNRLFAKTTHRGLSNAFNILIACVLISQCLSFGYSYQLIRQRFVDYQIELLYQAGNKLENILENLSLVEKQIIFLVNASPLFAVPNSSSTNTVAARDFEYELRNIRRSNGDIDEIFVIIPGSNYVLSSCVTNYDKMLLMEQPILDTVSITDKLTHISQTHSGNYSGFEGDGVFVVSFVRMIRNVDYYNDPSAIIQIDLSYDVIEETLQNINLDPSQLIYVINDSNHIVSALNREYLGVEIAAIDTEDFSDYNSGGEISSYQHCIRYSYPIASAGWELVVHIDNISMFQAIIGSMSTMLIIFVLTLSILIFLSHFFIEKVSAPIHELTEHMGTIGNDSLDAIQLTNGSADMMVLAHGYNTMLVRIGQLILKNKTQEMEKARAEYLSHMAQINPHFLYNTLETMRSIALRDDAAHMADIAHSMALLFKYSIDSRGDFVTLEEELNNVHNYITIQRYRFGSKFELFIDIPAALLKCEVLKFILQPMVENAMEHGWTKRKDQYLVIVIRAVRSKQDLIVSIHDNGAGMSFEKLKIIRERLRGKMANESLDTRFGIGLVNVQSRMRYQYGDTYGLNIQSSKTGTLVMLRMPYNLSGKENPDASPFNS